MARTDSTMLELGTRAPDFALDDTLGTTISRSNFEGRPLVVAFICNHCPYVKHIQHQLAEIAQDYQERIAFVAINSNDAERYPDDGPAQMKVERERVGYPFPYLYDADQAVARAYKAACTPDLYLFDADHKLVYRGQFDSSRPSNEQPVTGADLKRAMDQVLAGEKVPEDQQPSQGCNIKWKPGNEPDYFKH